MYNIKKCDLHPKLQEKLMSSSAEGLDEILGEEELKTKDKSIKGSINEVYDNKNSFRKSIILKLKERNISISDNADWGEIVTKIFSNLKKGDD